MLWYNAIYKSLSPFRNNSLNLKLSNAQLNILKPETKNATEKDLNFSSNLIGHSNDQTKFPHKLLLTDRQVPEICKVLANNLPADVKLSTTSGLE